MRNIIIPRQLCYHISCHKLKLKQKYKLSQTVLNAVTDEFTDLLQSKISQIKVVSSEFYFHKPITVHIELYLFYRFINFLLYIGQY